jgi:nucleoside 2-deoxyribosyltransferase
VLEFGCTQPLRKTLAGYVCASTLKTAGSSKGAVAKDIPLIRKQGFQVVDPWRGPESLEIQAILKLPYGDERRRALKSINERIGRSNELLIQKADFVVAVLDGVDVDSGTASEIGYA